MQESNQFLNRMYAGVNNMYSLFVLDESLSIHQSDLFLLSLYLLVFLMDSLVEWKCSKNSNLGSNRTLKSLPQIKMPCDSDAIRFIKDLNNEHLLPGGA